MIPSFFGGMTSVQKSIAGTTHVTVTNDTKVTFFKMKLLFKNGVLIEQMLFLNDDFQNVV